MNLPSCQDETAPTQPADGSGDTPQTGTPSDGDGASNGDTGNSDDTSGDTGGESGDGDTSGSDDGDATEPSEPADTDKPIVAVAASPTLAGGVVGGSTAKVVIDMTMQDAHLKNYTLTVNGAVATQVDNFDDPSAEVKTQYVWDVTSPNMVASGTYVITLTATDQAGNSASASQPVEVDTTPPDVTVEGGKLIKSGSITPSVTASDAHGVASYAWVASSTNPAPLSFDPTSAEPTFTPTVQGSYSVSLAVSDGLGNVSTQAFEFDYAPVLLTIPLPVNADPTEKLSKATTQTTAAPAVRQSSVDTTVDAGGDQSVLGQTASNAASVVSPASSASVIAPTNSGWQVLGILWYWWLVIAAAVFATWLAIRRFFFAPQAQKS